LRTVVCLCAVLLSACGGSRLSGDPDGVPVTFHVELERSFVREMANRQGRVGLGAGVGIGRGGGGVGLGVGLRFSSTHVTLLGGSEPAAAELFRQRIGWGSNRFTVPLRPGRELVITASVTGAREGWEVVGRTEIDPERPVVLLQMGEAGGQLRLTDQPSR